MYHLLGFADASAGGVTNERMSAVIDAYASVGGNNGYLLPKDWNVLWAYAVGTNLINARINQPHFRAVSIPSLGEIDASVSVTSLPPINWFYPPFLTAKAIDELTMEQTCGAGAVAYNGFLGLTDQPTNTVMAGDIYTLRATAAITAGNQAWGMGAFTLDQSIPSGTYDVVGMDVVGANLLAARLVFQGGGPRPGCIARSGVTIKPDRHFRLGRLGTWGTFANTAQPYIELFGTAAPTTQTIFLDVVKRS